MKIIVDHTSMQPIYEQIVEQIKKQILQGTLREGAPLDSVRMLAKDLKVSALTVKKAYDGEKTIFHNIFWDIDGSGRHCLRKNRKERSSSGWNS